MRRLLFVFFLIGSPLFSTPTLDWVAQYLPRDPVIVEAGAHTGTDTVRMSRRWPAGRVYAFEPNPQIYPQLRQAADFANNISTFPIALGNRKGTADFYLSKPLESGRECDAQSSLFPPSKEFWRWDWIGFEEPIQVPITTLDEWAKEHQVSRVDFLWLDMQGSEFQMLEASPEILKTVKVIQTEFSKLPFYQGTILFDDLTKWLEARGFRKVYEDPQMHGDAMFLRSDL